MSRFHIIIIIIFSVEAIKHVHRVYLLAKQIKNCYKTLGQDHLKNACRAHLKTCHNNQFDEHDFSIFLL